MTLPSFLLECSQNLLIQDQDDFRKHHLQKGFKHIVATLTISYSKISILIFPASFTSET